jgi:sugar phosphate isomerase/epimerase
MEILFLSTQWGHQHLELEDFIIKVKEAGYDGIDTWMPADVRERKKLISLLDEYKLCIVAHQHQAFGSTIEEYCKSFEYYLSLSMECGPLLINSHSGRDYFTRKQQLMVIDVAEEFSAKNNITVTHETHRGRIGYSPYNAMDLFQARPEMRITADFSHWTCVTESFLEHSPEIIQEAIKRTRHIHARVGYTQGPQIPDPRLVAWKEPVDFFVKIWEEIVVFLKLQKEKIVTTTPEFGPPPYMWTKTENGEPLSDQWEINLYMMTLLRDRFCTSSVDGHFPIMEVN